MSFKEGHIVALNFEMPNDGSYLEHPAVIISCDEVYSKDKCYVCVMISGTEQTDRFSFKLDSTMYEKPHIGKKSQVRCHLILYVLEKYILDLQPFNKLTPQAMERLIAHINDATFDAA
ncbi:PemK-like, MazF-like toxin of type II toxin-antitoxin system [Mucilaginibacter sp. OK268]|uniref:type II toxin-antitoxin system PemK/MazF family toxin n=1 Tax=Mucilaginibacter sp. OK268 TaxID=1881048 RepID=UPI000883A291|nr:type II toxin-antitoxin system PemK/MazF family toxin [Mucilaginibacter sp. OK268]SDP93727.1 PemK-like, MazF-like toxin of type II toxin-antitoxin system [Mucilaginibacter sp. OK268]